MTITNEHWQRLETILRNEIFAVPGHLLAAFTLGAACTGTLMVTGAAAIAVNRHDFYLSGWIVATVVAVSLLLLGGGIALDRSQATVDDVSFMQAMIPHHSLAITRSERFGNDDVRVCELAVEISEAQRREILEMDWLIDDINDNGAATTPEEAEQRPMPAFDVSADRQCPTG